MRDDTSGASLGEFRLRVGFHNLAIPFIGCTQHESIEKITNSPEMQQWSLGDIQYDRPIPRRIVEEAGVPRLLFGQRKIFITRPYQKTEPNPEMSRILSPDAGKEFHRFAESKEFFAHFLERTGFAMMHSFYRFNFRIIRSVKLINLAPVLSLKMPSRPIVPWKYSKPRTRHSLVFYLGLCKYQDALSI